MLRLVAGKLALLALCASPALFAFSAGPVAGRAGVPSDGGLTCVACHRTFVTANPDAIGSLKIVASPYRPGVTQTIQVILAHPEAKRWGFQLAARHASDSTRQAGDFTVNATTRVRCANGTDAPCGAMTQFAEHGSAEVTAVGAGATYSITWTPPADAVGDIVIWAAGNAADGNNANTNDRIYTATATVEPADCDSPGLPIISGAVSSASYQAQIAPGSLISIFGTGFQPFGVARGLFAADVLTGAFPQRLSCVAVEVDRVRAPITYAGYGQINVQAPLTTRLANAEVRVVVNPNSSRPVYSSPILVRSEAYSPALFTVSAGKAVAQFATGGIVTLYATGLGATNPATEAGVRATGQAACAVNPTITIGGVAVPATDVQYCGSVPTMITGLSQINVKLPASVKGDAAVVLTSGGISSPAGVTITVP